MKCCGPRLVVAFQAQIEAGRRDAPGFESGIDGLRRLESAHQQSGGDQQYQAYRNLRRDQRSANPTGGAPAGSRAGFLQRPVQVGVRGLQRRNQSETDPCGKRQCQGVENDPHIRIRIQLDGVHLFREPRHQQRNHGAQRPPRCQQAQGAAAG